jgi:pentatricopeptide repeat protein
MYCSSCGKQIPQDSNFCKHCGVRVDSAVPQTEPGWQPSESEILVDELGQVVAKGGEISDTIGALTGIEIAPGIGLAGSLGAKLAARRLPNDTYELVFQLSAQPAAVYATLINLFTKAGKIVDARELEGSMEIRGVVGSGFLNMNPALVSVSLFAHGEGHSQVKIQGSAKEGLIKQQAGKKAAERIAQQLLKLHQ